MTTIIFKDERNREWESFVDTSYYGLICVRLINDKQYGSNCSFHFTDVKKAKEFIELIKISR